MSTPDPGPPVADQDASARLVPTTDSYEFSDRENQTIRHLAEKMNYVGLFALALGIVIIALGVVLRQAVSIGSGVFFAMLGIWTERAGHQFRNVVATQGHDIRHLMWALEDVLRLYTAFFWICLVSLIGAIVVLTASFVY